ncbi:MAG: hypothetical protein HY549_03335 [Elusimicrobia bacterium]|nr:hypothetical protein [Elusimicrobiota bacterium]
MPGFSWPLMNRRYWFWLAAGLALIGLLLFAGGPLDQEPAIPLPPPSTTRRAWRANPHTNETLRGQLQDEAERLGIRVLDPAAVPDDTRPFLGEKLGRSEGREHAEAVIRELAAARQALERASGKKPSVPIQGRTAPVISQPADSGRPTAE